MNKASQNAFVKLNKAVEVSNGVEIITVAMAGVGPGPASPALQTHNRNVRREICLNIRAVSTESVPPAPLGCQLTPSISFMSVSPCYSCTQGCPAKINPDLLTAHNYSADIS